MAVITLFSIKNKIYKFIIKNKHFHSPLFKNTLFNSVGKTSAGILSILFISVILHYLGKNRFGIYAYVEVFIGILTLLDIGISQSIVKFFSDSYYSKNNKKINCLCVTSCFYYLFLVIIIGPVFIILINTLLDYNFINIDSKYILEAAKSFKLSLLLFLAIQINFTLKAIPIAFQRMEYSNSITLLNTVLFIFLGWMSLKIGYGVVGLIIAQTITYIITSCFLIIIIKRIFPKFKFNIRYFDFTIIKELFHFGIKLNIASIGSILTFQTDKLLIGYFLKSKAMIFITFYQVVSDLLTKIRQIPLLLISALLPAIVEMDKKNDVKTIKRLTINITCLISIISISVFIWFFIFSEQILTLWLGDGYHIAAVTLKIFSIAYLINIITGVGTTVAVGVSHPEIQMKAATLHCFLNLILSITFIIKWGYYGVVIGTGISLIISSLYFIIEFLKKLNLSFFSFIRETVTFPGIAVVLSYLITFTAKYYLKFPETDRLQIFLNLICFSSIFILIYYLIIFSMYYKKLIVYFTKKNQT